MNTYSSQNIYECSHLMAMKCELLKVEKGNGKAFFHFKDDDITKKHVLGFYNGTEKASSKALFDNYRSLKDMVFQR